ncbi:MULTISPECIES: hypothetical protein [Paenibacillus]|nr:hypothetical protein [Paenibacillus alvei]
MVRSMKKGTFGFWSMSLIAPTAPKLRLNNDVYSYVGDIRYQ